MVGEDQPCEGRCLVWEVEGGMQGENSWVWGEMVVDYELVSQREEVFGGGRGAGKF